MSLVELERVPHIEVIKWRLEQISSEIKIEDVRYLSSNEAFVFALVRNDRHCQLTFSREFLDDLPDLSASRNSSYWKTMHAKLSDQLIEPIERNGLVPYTKERLKIHLYEHIRQATEKGGHVHKFNTLGKTYQQGSLESFLKVKFTDEERENAGLAWEELKRQGTIVPTYKDLVDPENWVKIARTKPGGGILVDHLFLSSTCQDMIDLRAALISDLQSKGIRVEYSESPAFAGLSTEDVHDICLDKVAETSAFLLILGYRYGSPYTGKREIYKGLSVVHAEFRVAAESETKPLLVYVRDPVKYEHKFWQRNPTAQFEADVKIFDMLQEIESITNRKIWIDGFRDVEELKAKIFERFRSEVTS